MAKKIRLFSYAYLGCSILAVLILVLELGKEGPCVFYAIPGNQSAIYGFIAFFALAEGSFPWLGVLVDLYVIALPILVIAACILLNKKQKTWLMHIILVTDAIFPAVMFINGLSDLAKYMQSPQMVAMWIGGLLDLGCLAVLFVIKRGSFYGRTENFEAVDTGK